MAPRVILYAYPQSPFAQKLELVLLFKRIDYSYVEVPRIPPRDALQKLGITYRRIPVLAIGADLYLDTSLATIALEDAFPEPSLKGRSWGLQTASAFFWSDRSLFPLAAGLLPWDSMPAEFIKDRSGYRGGDPINPEKMIAIRPQFLSALRQHMDLIEGQLSGRSSSSNFILDTATPVYLDLALFFSLRWVSQFGTADSIFSPQGAPSFPLVLDWMSAIRVAIGEAIKVHPTSGVPTKISADEGAALVTSASVDDSIRTDADEPLLLAGWLKLQDVVEVTPTDTGKVPQVGKLVVLNRQRAVVEVETSEGKCRVHVPRLGFSIAKKK